MSNVPSQHKNWHTSTKDIQDQAEMTRNMKPVFLSWLFFLTSCSLEHWLPSFLEIRLKRLHPRCDCEQTSNMTVFESFQNHPKTHLISSDHLSFKILHLVVVVVVVAALFQVTVQPIMHLTFQPVLFSGPVVVIKLPNSLEFAARWVQKKQAANSTNSISL